MLYRLTALVLLFLHAPLALTQTSNAAKNIHIQANYMKFDMDTGSSTYEGNVKISQGEIELYGEKVVVLREQDEIQQINVDGAPARYTQDPDTENTIRATSQHMKYFAQKNRLVMTVDAHLQQPDHSIKSQRIVYDTKNKIVIAGDSEQDQQGGRVKITLTPKKESTDKPDATEKK